MREATLLALAAHGVIDGAVPALCHKDEETLSKFTKAGIDVDALADQLLREVVVSFTKSWIDLLNDIATKSTALQQPNLLLTGILAVLARVVHRGGSTACVRLLRLFCPLVTIYA
jgi:transaldolase